MAALETLPAEVLDRPGLSALGLYGNFADAFALAVPVAQLQLQQQQEQEQQPGGDGAGGGRDWWSPANVKLAVVAASAMARVRAEPDALVSLEEELVMASLVSALCRQGGADINLPLTVLWECCEAYNDYEADDCISCCPAAAYPPELARQVTLGAWIALAAARLGLPYLLWAVLTLGDSSLHASIAGVDWGPAPGGSVHEAAQLEFAQYMSDSYHTYPDSFLGVTVWRAAVIRPELNQPREVWGAQLCCRVAMGLRPPLGAAAGRELAMAAMHTPLALAQDENFMNSVRSSLLMARLQLTAEAPEAPAGVMGAVQAALGRVGAECDSFTLKANATRANPAWPRRLELLRSFSTLSPGTSPFAFTEHDMAAAALYNSMGLTTQPWTIKAFTCNEAALDAILALQVGRRRQQQQQRARARALAEEEAPGAARAAALAAADAVLPQRIVAAARKLAAAGLGGAGGGGGGAGGGGGGGGGMAGLEGGAIRRRSCMEAAAEIQATAQAIAAEVEQLTAAAGPQAAALARAMLEERFAGAQVTAAAEAFAGRYEAQMAFYAAIGLGRMYTGDTQLLYTATSDGEEQVLVRGMVLERRHAASYAAREGPVFSIPPAPLAVLARMGAAPTVVQLRQLLGWGEVESGGVTNARMRGLLHHLAETQRAFTGSALMHERLQEALGP